MYSSPLLDLGQFQKDNEKSGFYCNKLPAHLQAHHRHIHLPHKHDSYLLVIFTRGSGVHEVDFNSYPVKPGAAFFLNPGQTHHWKLSHDADGYVVLHDREFYDLHYSDTTVEQFPFYYSTKNKPVLYLKSEVKEITRLLASIEYEYQSDFLLKNKKLCSLLDLLYIELSRAYLKGKYLKIARTSRYSSQLKQLDQLIEKKFLVNKSPASYASMLHITLKHLNRITKSLRNKTTHQLITDRILLEAKRMIVHRTNTIAEIADALGFPDYSYFTRIFKKHCGETPTVFARRYLKKALP
jgi:AraC-like DNA-binding protein